MVKPKEGDEYSDQLAIDARAHTLNQSPSPFDHVITLEIDHKF